MKWLSCLPLHLPVTLAPATSSASVFITKLARPCVLHEHITSIPFKLGDKNRAVTCKITEFQILYHIPCYSTFVCVLLSQALKKVFSHPCK